MNIQYDLEEITARYGVYYGQALKNGLRHLPYYEVQQWDKVLNDVELRVFADIRTYGIPMYPIFPVAEHTYFHFANPFKKVAIEIVYKHTPLKLLERKKMLFGSQGWNVYTTKSSDTHSTIEEFFINKRKDITIEFGDMNEDQQYRFAEKFKDQSSACLLFYIAGKHFSEIH